MHSILTGFLASLAAGLATPLGALPILFTPNLNERLQGIFLGFGGGVMLAATSFSLIIPGTMIVIEQGSPRWTAALIMVAGILVGALFLELAHRYFPHEHFFKGNDGSTSLQVARIWLFIAAITIHNFPEGLAVGVGAASEPWREGLALAAGIGLQNMPEGFGVAVSL